jgi:hypothetical protein
MDYQTLLNEVKKELGRPELTSKLPELVRRAEDLVWSVVTGDWVEQTVSVSLEAGTSEYEVQELSLLLKPTRFLLTPDIELQQAPLRVKTDLEARFDSPGQPQFVLLNRNTRYLYVTPTPDKSYTLLIIGDFRDDYINANSTHENSRLLQHCPDLLKLQTLLQVPDERIKNWLPQYDSVLRAYRTMWVRQRRTGYVRNSARRWL